MRALPATLFLLPQGAPCLWSPSNAPDELGWPDDGDHECPAVVWSSHPEYLCLTFEDPSDASIGVFVDARPRDVRLILDRIGAGIALCALAEHWKLSLPDVGTPSFERVHADDSGYDDDAVVYCLGGVRNRGNRRWIHFGEGGDCPAITNPDDPIEAIAVACETVFGVKP